MESNVNEAARELGVAPRTLMLWSNKNLIPYQIIGKDHRGIKRHYSREDIYEIKVFIEERIMVKEKYGL